MMQKEIANYNNERKYIYGTESNLNKSKFKSRKNKTLYLFLIITFFLTIPITVGLGPVYINIITVWNIILSKIFYFTDFNFGDWSVAEENIIWEIRFPRVLLGAFVGAGLATVGVAMQALVRNPLADPFILGVSSGASVGATMVILFGTFNLFGQYALSLSAFIGALASVVIVFLISRTNGKISTVRLLLSGIAISAIFNGITNLIIMFAPQERGIQSALFWMLGSLSTAKWENLFIPVIVVLLGITFLFIQSRSLNILLMGEETAITLGLNINFYRKLLLIFTSLLTGVLVAISGAIGFVGLMIPHIVRVLVGSNHKLVLPISALLGAIFLIWADVLARLTFAPEEIPIGVITSICGGPFFIWLLRRNTYRFGGES